MIQRRSFAIDHSSTWRRRLKLASFHAAGRDRFGVVLEDQLVDLSSDGEPRTLLDLIEAGRPAMERVRRLAEAEASSRSGRARYALDEVLWHAPVRRPSKICCTALNNSANADRILSGPKHPAMFIKPASALVGHGCAIECRPEYGRTHPEPELAVVIGTTARNVRPEDAYDYVFGYTIHNDITSPTMRTEDTFHYRAIHPKGGATREIEYVDTWVSYPGRYKCADTFACMGPWVVTKDEIPDPHALRVTCSHRDELITDDNTRNLFYKTPELLAFYSRYLTLVPGDIVSLGTALQKSSGGGAVQNIDLNRLGGPVSVTIERIGTLTNTVTWV
jgi:2-keto-4-pentenoate hydratase/2-oxohepta-3-ene-1,7-dioic acid hydratase in catechol pathway